MGGKGDDSGGGGGQPLVDGVSSKTGEYVWDSEIGWVTPEAYNAKRAPKPVEEAPEPAPEPEPEAVVAAPDPTANMPAAPATDETLAPPASLPGGAPATPAPGAGDALGGAVLKPPRYWTGGLDQYESAHRTGRGGSGAGSIRTTQT